LEGSGYIWRSCNSFDESNPFTAYLRCVIAMCTSSFTSFTLLKFSFFCHISNLKPYNSSKVVDYHFYLISMTCYRFKDLRQSDVIISLTYHATDEAATILFDTARNCPGFLMPAPRKSDLLVIITDVFLSPTFKKQSSAPRNARFHSHVCALPCAERSPMVAKPYSKIISCDPVEFIKVNESHIHVVRRWLIF
jgi:hypothetical protein